MNEGFIYKVAEYILHQHREELDKVKVVFPNRRAGLFFNQSVATLATRPVWSPSIYAVREYIEELTGKTVADTLPLVMEMYSVYKNIVNTEESFEQFYPWGEMLLGDFDDLDKYMVHAKDLFRNLQAVHELSHDLSYLSEEQLRLIRQFWDHIPPGTSSKHAGIFLTVWEKLYPLYEAYKMSLEEKEIAYEGMLYREVGEKAKQQNLDIGEAFPVYLAGFNALTPAEESLFDFLKKTGIARFFWDYDVAYIKTPAGEELSGHEAGRFIRKYLKRFPPPVDLAVFDRLLSEDKDIRVYSSPNRTTQAWVVHKVLGEWKQDPAFKDERIAVVLGDEHLLLPVLHAIPEEAGEINVTMGYPLQDSPVFAFFEAALILQKNVQRNNENKPLFYYQDVLNFMHNPLLAEYRNPAWSCWEEKIKNQNRIYIRGEDIPSVRIMEPVFKVPDDPVSYAGDLLEVLYEVIASPGSGEDDTGADLNIEVYYQLYLLVNRLNQFLADGQLQLPVEAYMRLLLYLAGHGTVSFYGEPLVGLQVMGVLETRLLDFDRVIILSVNEGNMPGPVTVASYIPYSLRKGFGLPTYEHRDAVYAYYFFRLIQRARYITLVYHTESDNGQTGERSRFISQLKYLTKKHIREINMFFQAGVSDSPGIRIEKDEKILELLNRSMNQADLSPSALNTYLSCRLKFYYKYIAGIKEPAEITEDVDAALFGTVVHKTMEILYRPFINREITGDSLSGMLKGESIREAVGKSYRELLYYGERENTDLMSGLHHIIETVIDKYIGKILEYDKQFVPFTIIGLEQPVHRDITISVNNQPFRIRLGGQIDRIDQCRGQMRLVDYKTGKDNPGFNDLKSLFSRGDGKRNQAVFQILLYSWIYRERAVARPYLYFIRRMFESETEQELQMRQTKKKEPFDFDDELTGEFERLLKDLLTELFDPGVPFDQTEDVQLCRYCPYNSICSRQ